MNASAAVLARQNVPYHASLQAMANMRSMLKNVSAAELVQVFVPLVLLLLNNSAVCVHD